MLSQTPRSSSAPITFRHFCRKGYALFACLGREVRVGVLTVATLSAAAPCLATDSKPVSFVEAEGGLATDSAGTELAEALVSATRAPLATSFTA